MPPVKHGRFTLNTEQSRLTKDNSSRYRLVVLDEWKNGQLTETHRIELTEPVQQQVLLSLINAVNSGKIQARFLLP